MSAEGNTKQGLSILCLDGGGVRALSSLLLLSEVMDGIQGLEGLDAPPDPCKYFDVIAGTGTGGVVACMLGRLRLSTKQTIKCYGQLVTDVFSEKKWISSSKIGVFKSSKLKYALKRIVREATGNEDEPMMMTQKPAEDDCKVMVFAMSKHNLNARIPTVFRSYRGHSNQTPDCLIWEALCATMAHPSLFKSIAIGDVVKQSFIDGGLGCNNPIAHVLAEVKTMYPERYVGSIISIGAGHTQTIQIPRSAWFQRFQPTDMIVAMKAIVEDSERAAEDMAMRFEGTRDVYYRFNVDQGMQNVQPSEWERLDEVAAHTWAYIQQGEVAQRMKEAVRAVQTRRHIIATTHIDGQIKADSAEIPGIMCFQCSLPTPVFTGRKAEVQQVKTCIIGGGGERRVCVVHGLGGAGKTQLALKVIECTRESWATVLYVDASSRGAIESALRGFSVINGVGKSHEDTIRWLESRRERWLLVFDNADSPSLNVHKFFPKCDHGSILITTRLHDMTRLARGPCADCNLSCMNPEEALELLIKAARMQKQPLQPDEVVAANALLQDVGRLALAIVHVGAFIGHSGITFSKYRALFLVRRQDMLEESGSLLIKIDEYDKTVYTAWKMCYDLLGPIARSMLWMIAFLHFDGITEAIFERAAVNMARKTTFPLSELEATALSSVRKLLCNFLDSEGQWDSLRFLRAMNEILSYSLIELDRIKQSYRIHILVQDWARTVTPHSLDLMLECATTLLSLSIGNDASAEGFSFRRGLGLHIGNILSKRCHTVNAFYASYFAKVYGEMGHWKEAEILCVQALDAYRQLLGDEQPRTLAAMHQLAMAYRHQGQWDRAEELQLQALDTQTRLLGDEHPHTLAAMQQLAMTHRHKGQWDKAEKLQVQTLNVQTRLLGNEHPEVLTTMHNLALTYKNQGQWDAAENLQVQVLDARRRLLGGEHPDTLTTMNNLALTYRKQCRKEEAESLQMQVLDARKRLLGDKHPDTLTAMHNLALTYKDQGRRDKAEKLQIQVLNARKQLFSDNHPDTLTAMHNLALTYKDLGRRAEAEKLQVEALDARKRLLGDRHPDTLNAMYELALTYQDQGRWDEAEKLQAEVLDAQARLLGDSHPDTLITMHCLALTYQDQGRQDESEGLMVELVMRSKRALGEEHTSTLQRERELRIIQARR